MQVLANILGFAAVAVFVLSYQFKNRSNIILCNALSRVLYVSQYFLLGAYEGAWLDITAFFISLLYFWNSKKSTQGNRFLLVILSNFIIMGVGLISYRDIFSLFPILGVIFETQALYFKNTTKILLMSLLGAPFWLVYNLLNNAYGSAVGNVITLVSITVALVRIYYSKNNNAEKNLS